LRLLIRLLSHLIVKKSLGLCFLALGCGFTVPLMAQTVTGYARAIDGDSLRIKTYEIRLFGVDAFEYDQACGQYACGRLAFGLMQRLTKQGPVNCRLKTVDNYGRHIATCFAANGQDIAQIIVRQGLGVAYRRFSRRYIDDEQNAKRQRIGAWAYPFQSPENWRGRRQR
jgi:endonuclease YncB( thermonuclease family)